MKTLFLILTVLIGFLAQSQNLIINGDNWTDSNNDGLADSWYIGPYTNEHQIDSGAQYVSSYFPGSTCQQVKLGQVLDIANPIKTYLLSLDMASSEPVWLLADHGTNPYLIKIMQGGESKHYDIIFNYTFETFHSIEFITQTGNTAWVKIDNVVMVEYFPVGITETVKPFENGQIYSYPQGVKLDRIPASGYYVKNRKLHFKVK